MRPEEEPRELPVAEAGDDDVEASADLGPWGAEAVQLGVDAEPTPRRASASTDSLRPVRHRWATASTLGLAVLLLGALIVTALPEDPDNDTTARPSNPANKRDVASAPRAARPRPTPSRAERDPTRDDIKTRKPHTRAAPAPAPPPSPTYLPSPAPPPPTEPVTPSPAPAPTAAEPSPAAQMPAASGAAVAEEFGFER